MIIYIYIYIYNIHRKNIKKPRQKKLLNKTFINKCKKDFPRYFRRSWSTSKIYWMYTTNFTFNNVLPSIFEMFTISRKTLANIFKYDTSKQGTQPRKLKKFGNHSKTARLKIRVSRRKSRETYRMKAHGQILTRLLF